MQQALKQNPPPPQTTTLQQKPVKAAVKFFCDDIPTESITVPPQIVVPREQGDISSSPPSTAITTQTQAVLPKQERKHDVVEENSTLKATSERTSPLNLSVKQGASLCLPIKTYQVQE